MRRFTTAAAALAVALTGATAGASERIGYQGVLVDRQGSPLETGRYEVSFRVYDGETAGTLLWGPQILDGQALPGHGPRVQAVEGRFSVSLGPVDVDGDPIADAFAGPDAWLEMKVGADPPVAQRQRITSVPYALAASSAPILLPDGATILTGSVAAQRPGDTETITFAPPFAASPSILLAAVDDTPPDPLTYNAECYAQEIDGASMTVGCVWKDDAGVPAGPLQRPGIHWIAVGPPATTPQTVPGEVGYQAALTGLPQQTAPYQLSFSVYDQQRGGTPLWGPQSETVQVVGGRFSVGLATDDGGSPITEAFPGPESWLEVQLGTDVAAPRQRFLAAPRSLGAASAEGLVPLRQHGPFLHESPIGDEGWYTTAGELADMDGDGDLDFLTANGGVGVALYVNDPGCVDPPVFCSVQYFPNVSYVFDSAVGDVDGDGDLDLVLAKHADDDDRLYLNNGTSVPFADAGEGIAIGGMGEETQHVVLGDVDGDGDLDLVAARHASPTSINKLYINIGCSPQPCDPFVGLYDIGPPGEPNRALAFGDVDGDTDLDLVVGTGWNYPTRLYLNNGCTAPPVCNPFPDPGTDLLPVGPVDGNYTTDLALGDVDGDGRLDLVVCQHSWWGYLYPNNGCAAPCNPFSDPGIRITEQTPEMNRVALGDMDGDGDVDIVMNGRGRDDLLFLNNGCAPPPCNPFDDASVLVLSPYVEDHQSFETVLGDVDGDGDLDLATAKTLDNRLQLNEVARGRAPASRVLTGAETEGVPPNCAVDAAFDPPFASPPELSLTKIGPPPADHVVTCYATQLTEADMRVVCKSWDPAMPGTPQCSSFGWTAAGP